MKRASLALRFFLALSMLAGTPAATLAGSAPATPAASRSFDSYWHDGKAEMDGYQYSVTRYGQVRSGQCVAVYVTEPFSRLKRVKVDDPAHDPKDTYDVLKLNLVRDFQTGIYDYNTMSSLFVRSEDFDPVKVSFASMEWCGNVYEEIQADPGTISQRLSSYFEGESAARTLDRPKGGLLEEELFIRVRGLRGEYLKPGETKRVPFLPSAFHRRLTHQPLEWATATIERLAGAQSLKVPAGTFSVTVYSVKTADGREGLFHVERAYPHRLVQWEWKQTLGKGGRWAGDSNDSGKLAGSARLEYWKLHGNGDERYLKGLGLQGPPR
jgi:hypothetical protein